MKRITSLSLVLLFTFALVSSAVAQQGQRRQGPPAGDRPNWGNFQRGDFERPMLRLPDLTDEQHEQIQQVHQEAQEQRIDLQNQLNEKRARLRTLTTGSEADTDAVNQVVEEIGSLRTQLMKLHLQTHMDVRELLTDEQKLVFDVRRGGFPAGQGFRRGMKAVGRGFQRGW